MPSQAPPPASPGMASSAEKVTEPLVTASATRSAREPGDIPSVSAPTSAPETLDRPVDIPRSVVPVAVGCSLGGPHNLSEANRKGTAPPHIPIPPEDFRLNKLLLDISNSITETELDQIKFLFKGEGGIRQRVYDNIQTSLELFDFLKDYGFIGRDNLIYLQSILRILEKPRLIEKAIQYAREVGDTIYFYPPSEPANGYTHVKMHVAGKDFSTFNRLDLEILRTTLSMILSLPSGGIVFRGIEPRSSLLITVMIPSQYANILKSLASQKGRLDNLSAIGIDTITIGEEPFHIDGSTSTDTTETQQQMRMLTLYQQLVNTKRLLDERDVEVLQLIQQIRKKQQDTCAEELSCQLRPEEIEKLKGQYQWRKKDGQAVKLHDDRFLLQLLYTIEIDQKGQVPFAGFVRKCFELLGRKDLTRRFSEECEHHETSLKAEDVQLPTQCESLVSGSKVEDDSRQAGRFGDCHREEQQEGISIDTKPSEIDQSLFKPSLLV